MPSATSAPLAREPSAHETVSLPCDGVSKVTLRFVPRKSCPGSAFLPTVRASLSLVNLALTLFDVLSLFVNTPGDAIVTPMGEPLFSVSVTVMSVPLDK